MTRRTGRKGEPLLLATTLLLLALAGGGCSTNPRGETPLVELASPPTDDELIASAIAGMPRDLFLADELTVTLDVDQRKWRRFLSSFKGWDVVKSSELLGEIVAGGDYAVLNVSYAHKVVDDGSSLIVIDRRVTSRVVWLMDRLMDDPTKAILYAK